jgi:hypothetical protein
MNARRLFAVNSRPNEPKNMLTVLLIFVGRVGWAR